MKYFDEMTDQHGFHDGEAIPQDAWVHRKLYVEAINAIAGHRGSKVKAVEFDRPGFHNSCMILFQRDTGADTEWDDIMSQVISDLDDAEIETFVHVRASYSKKNFNRLIKQLKGKQT